jgi:monofunctional biosynthetic peptidoglycan transglycosylase
MWNTAIWHLGVIAVIGLGGHAMAAEKSMSKVLFDFADTAEIESWAIINDGVMGGRSESALEVRPDSTGLFSGRVSLENNGGFASTRTRPRDFKLEGYTGIRIRVKGDGRSYQFRVRRDERFDGIAYKRTFTPPANQWQVIDLPFDEFRASFRGRPVPPADPLDPAQIRQIGLLIADKKAGKFMLQIDWIQAYGRSPEP